MLEDRSYMREPSFRSGRSAAVMLLIANAAALVLQLLFVRYGSFPVDKYLALSLEGLRHGYVWQLLTYQFLHAGWIHLILNCWMIYVFGKPLEDSLGKKAFLALYFSSGILGGMMHVLCAIAFGGHFAGDFVVGASAGAFGLLAAYAMLGPERPLTLLLFFILPITVKAKYLLLMGAIIALVGMVVPTDNVAHAAHMGGMIAGVFFVTQAMHWRWSWPWKRRMSQRPPAARKLVKVGAESTFWRSKSIDADDLPKDEFLAREVDPILDKISAQGIHSLTDRERRVLEKARAKVGKR